ncbi:hypothetical protein ACOXQS_004657, partial [Escherichia coli O79:H51]
TYDVFQPTGRSAHDQSGVMILPLIVVDLLMIIRGRKLSEKIFDLFFLSARSEYYATGFPFWPI